MATIPSDPKQVQNGLPDTLAQMEMNYPYFRQFVYEKLREEFEQTLEELPTTDLESLVREWDAKKLEEFIQEFETTREGPKT